MHKEKPQRSKKPETTKRIPVSYTNSTYQLATVDLTTEQFQKYDVTSFCYFCTILVSQGYSLDLTAPQSNHHEDDDDENYGEMAPIQTAFLVRCCMVHCL